MPFSQHNTQEEEMTKIFDSLSNQIDDLLYRICEKLELTPSQFHKAEQRYEGLGKWLSDEKAILGPAQPLIYPQGSAKIGTTVKPLTFNEFDIDLICELQLDARRYTPSTILKLVLERLTAHDTYKGLLVPGTNRCIRLKYADEFHLDIVPAVPAQNGDMTSILIPDREANSWIPTNPKGYASWFEKQAAKRLILEKAVRVEPLPVQQNGDEKSPLKKAVQLMKRNRDLCFDSARQKKIPKSIILTTLAGDNYDGNQSTGMTFQLVLSSIIDSILSSGNRRLVVLNPVLQCEDLSEAWASDPEAHRMFVDWIRDLSDHWTSLSIKKSMPEISDLLGQLFGEDITHQAIREQTEIISKARESDLLKTIGPSASLAIPRGGENAGTPIRRNTFFGR